MATTFKMSLGHLKVPPSGSLKLPTPWLHVAEGLRASVLEPKLTAVPPQDKFVLMLSVGIRMGTPLAKMLDEVKYAGCGRVVPVV